MQWINKHYEKPKTICCSDAILPVIKDAWEYCPKCGKPAKRNWLTKRKVLSGWLKVFAWWPMKVANCWVWLKYYERVLSLTGVNSSAGGFEYTGVEYTRLITERS